MIHLPPTARFKSTYDPDGRMKPPDDDRPRATASDVRARIATQYDS